MPFIAYGWETYYRTYLVDNDTDSCLGYRTLGVLDGDEVTLFGYEHTHGELTCHEVRSTAGEEQCVPLIYILDTRPTANLSQAQEVMMAWYVLNTARNISMFYMARNHSDMVRNVVEKTHCTDEIAQEFVRNTTKRMYQAVDDDEDDWYDGDEEG